MKPADCDARRFQYVSDLHLEARRHWPLIPREAPVLILAGDIGSPKKETMAEFLRDVNGRFERVIYVAGNHEYFGNTMREVNEQLTRLLGQFTNTVYLRNSTYTLTDVYDRPVRFVGSTLWAPCPSHVRNLRDFRKIFVGEPARRFQPEDMQALYQENVAYLTGALEEDLGTDTIVVTHHGPLRETNGPYMDHPASLAYASDLEHLMQGRHVKAWIYGHTHQNMRLQRGSCLVATNALGYPGERVTGFVPGCTFEI